MSRILRLTLIFAFILAFASPGFAMADPPDFCGPAAAQFMGTYSGGTYLFCVPLAGWNGDLVLYAHGYVSILETPGEIPAGQVILPDGTSISQLISTLGYAFGMTSYQANGLAVVQGVQDVVALVPQFQTATGMGAPTHIYLAGASEGGLITTLATEQYPQVFTGGLATCGPIGDFRKQINYWGDFRVVFDAFFPEVANSVLPNTTPVDIPLNTPIPPGYTIDETYWTDVISPTIRAAVLADLSTGGSKTSQLLRVTGAQVDAANPVSILETILGIWWYNVFATNNGKDILGGQPFDNNPRWYFGSNNDFWLNKTITQQGHRYDADLATLNAIKAGYQTSGVISTQLVTLHTTGDPIVPFWHQPLYRLKAYSQGSFWHYTGMPILRYGHCNFKPAELLAGFAILVLKTGGLPLQNVQAALPDASAFQDYQRLVEQAGEEHIIYLPVIPND